ncbi:MAG TPA: AMP-binding protein [Rhizomicrobium sp.]|jgi:acyl-CoA synthetase (AMP-forming)/AMP-acid ligase II|nr:AMP-binding protein [Rhizomicrobium sp.]
MTLHTTVQPSLISEIVPMWAASAPDRVALADGGRTWTYAELDGAVRDTAAWLAKSDVRPGDRVMLVCENCVAAVALYLACTAIGAWPVIVNAKLSDREVDEIHAHSAARRMIFTTGISPKARVHAARIGSTNAEPSTFGAIALSALNESAIPELTDATPDQNIAALIYTTGTTGKPKGVMLTHRNLMFVAQASAKARALTGDDRVYAVLPVSHILGLTGVLLGALVSGASVHLTSRFDPAAALKAMENDRLSVMIGTPSMYALLCEYAARTKRQIAKPALRLISSAGAPLDAATKANTERTFGQTLHNGYGITECSPTITLTSLDAPRSDCAIGRVLPGIETRLVDSDGKDVAAGETGELWIRSPGVMKGYYKAPEETAQALTTDGWFKSGDLARFDDGNLFIVGRAKDLIIRFGFNVYPAEVEGVLNGFAGVARSAVIGVKSGDSEDVIAFVQPSPGSNLTEAALADYAAANLVPYKRPSKITLLEALPMSPAGKILKHELAAFAAA